MAARRGKGDGGLIQRHDHPTCPPIINGVRAPHRCRGRWVGTLDLGFIEGKRVRKTVYGNTRKEAHVKLERAKRDRESHALVMAAPTVEVWLTYWVDVICVEKGLKATTMRSHRSTINRYLIPAFGKVRLDRLTPEHVRTLYARMRADGLAEATLRQTHAVLSRALKVAERESKVSRNVAAMIDPPKVERRRRASLTLEQARTVLASTDDPRWWLALFLAMRQGEVLALRWRDIDLLDGTLTIKEAVSRVPGRGFVFDAPKSETSIRTLPLPTPVLSRLTVYRAATEDGEDALVFPGNAGKPRDPKADWKAWRDLLASSGVPHVALHAARNTTASLLEAAGVPDRIVMEILGHSTVQVTHGYQRAELTQRRQAMQKLDALYALPRVCD